MQSKPRYLSLIFLLFALSAYAKDTSEFTQFQPFTPPTFWDKSCVQYTAAALLKARGVDVTSEVYDAIGADINQEQSGVPLQRLADYLTPWFQVDFTENNTTADLQTHLSKGLPIVVSLETDPVEKDGFKSTHAVILLPENLSPHASKRDHWTIEDNGIGRDAALALKSKSAHKHKSFGMNITSDRLANLSQGDGAKAQVKVLDLVSPEGEAMGTRVELTIGI